LPVHWFLICALFCKAEQFFFWRLNLNLKYVRVDRHKRHETVVHSGDPSPFGRWKRTVCDCWCEIAWKTVQKRQMRFSRLMLKW
jgi:hypothetical protein